MALLTFTPARQPSLGTAVSRTPKVNDAKFGEGYSQRSPDGLNADLQTWDLTWNGLLDSEADEIEDFFAARKGAEAFNWTPPGKSTSIKVICPQWKRTQGAQDSMTAQFKQVADLDL